jgi:O-antigen ligase
MSEPRAVPGWFPYLDLACVAAAGALWYAFPQVGAWPLVLALAPWALRLALTGRLTERTAFDIPLVLFVLVAAVSVWSAYDRQMAWAKFWLIVGGVLLFYALVNAQSLGNVRVWLLALLGAGVAAYFLVTHDWQAQPAKIAAVTRLGQALQAPLPEIPGDRLHPNVAGGIMAAMLPFAGWAVVQAWQGIRRDSASRRVVAGLALLLGIALLALTLLGLIMTTSRGAWLALGGALLLAGLWLLAGWLSRGSARRRAWLFPALLALLLAVALGVGSLWPGSPLAIFDLLPGRNMAFNRAALFERALTLARDYPLIGAGLGGFRMLYSTYVLLLHVGHTNHSHNLYLDVAIEQGLFALLVLAWMGMLFARAAWRALSGPHHKGRGALVAAALSLAVILFHGLVDDPLYGSRAVLFMFVPLAFAVPFLKRPARRRWQRWLYVLPLALLVLALDMILRGPLLSLVYSNLGAVHQSQAELSVYSWPEYPGQDAVRRQVDLSRPVAEFERALELDPDNATANRRLGMIALSLGEYDAALRYLEAARAVEGRSMTVQQLLGEALIVNGRLEEGQALWAGVSNEVGQLDRRFRWYRHIKDQERMEWIRQAIDNR